MPARFEVNIKKMIRLYDRGHSVQSMAAELQVSRGVITKRMRELGMKIRNQSEANYLRMGRMTLAERQALVASANDALRGATRTRESLVRKALTLQRQGKLSAIEQEYCDELRKRGVKVTPLAALDKFNVDLACVPAKVAIEVQCSWHTAPRKAMQDQAKLNYLMRQGWLLTYVDKKHTTAKQLDALAQLCKKLQSSSV